MQSNAIATGGPQLVIDGRPREEITFWDERLDNSENRTDSGPYRMLTYNSLSPRGMNG